MKGLQLRLKKLLNNNYYIYSLVPILGIILISLIFFYQSIIFKKIPLPTDALVGAHIPWIKYSWEGYPAGVPIKNQEITDAISQFYPWRALVGEFWRKGKVPLWNFYMFNGTPLLATLHSAAVYPFNFLYIFLNDVNAWSALVYLQILLSLIFMYLFLRENSLKIISSMFGAIAFTFSGYMIAWLEFATGGHAGLWLPLLLYLQKKYIDTKKVIFFVFIPLVFFFIFTAGDFQVPFYMVIVYVLYTLYRYMAQKRDAKQLFMTLLALVIGFFIAALQLLPTIELYKNSVRFDDPYIQQYFYGLMDWQKIVNFIWPDFFGNVVTRNYWGQFGFHEYMSYFGIISLIFFIFSLVRKNFGEEKFYRLLLLLSLLFLFPTPLAFLPYKLKIPALSTSSASRILFIVVFSGATLSAYGFNKYISNTRHSLTKVIVTLLSITIGVIVGLLISLMILGSNTTVVNEMTTNLKVALRNIVPGTLILLTLLFIDWSRLLLPKFPKSINKLLANRFLILLIFILSLADLLRYAWKNTPFSERRFLYPEVGITDYLKQNEGTYRIAGGIPTNLFIPYKFYSAEGYDPIYPRTNSEWYSVVDWGNNNYQTGRYGVIHYFNSPIINYSALKYVIDYKKDTRGQIESNGSFYPGIMPPRFTEVYSDKDIYIFKNNDSLPYIWLSSNFEVIKNKNEIINRLVKSVDPILLLESDTNIKKSDNPLQYNVSNIIKGYNTIDFDVESSADSLVFLSESNYTGWRAYVDNQKVQIIKANYIFQAVPVIKGKHHIKFIYSPESFKIGKWLSISALTILLGFYIYNILKRRLRTK